MAGFGARLATRLWEVGIGLVICTSLFSVALAEQTPRDPRLEQALVLADQGQSAKAIALTEQVLGGAASDIARWYARETLATIKHLDGRDAEALPLLRALVASAETLFGPDDPALVYPLRMLGATEGNLGDDAAVTLTMLRSLRLARTLAQNDPATYSGDLLATLSDLSRHFLDTENNLSAALLAAELTIQSQPGDVPDLPEAQEGALLRALAHLRMGHPAIAASHALPAWRKGDQSSEDAADLAFLLDNEIDEAARGLPNTQIAEWVEAATSIEAERTARETTATTAAEPMMAALNRGDPIAADLAARSVFDRMEADDPIAVVAYFALMSGTFRADRTDLAATWAARLAELPGPYLASLVEDPAYLFQEIATQLLAEGRARNAAKLAEAIVTLQSLRGHPQNVKVQNALTLFGAALRDMGENRTAEQTLNRAIDLGALPGPQPARDRATLQAMGDLGLLLLDSGRRNEAMVLYERAVELLQNGSVNRESGGWLFILDAYLPMLASENQNEKALNLAQTAVQVAQTENDGPEWGEINALELLARTQLALGDPAAAVTVADQAIAIAATNPRLDASNANVIAATAYFRMGDAAAANTRLAIVAAGDPDATPLAFSAIEQANAGDLINARQLLARAIATLPPDSPAIPYLTATDGIMLLLSGELPAALEQFRAATQTLTQPDRRAEPRSRDHLALHVDTALKLADTETGVQSLNFATEAFQVAQRVNDISAGAALGRSAARFQATTGDGELRARELEDAERALTAARAALLDRLAKGGDASGERATLEASRRALDLAGDALAAAFPAYRALADPKPLDLISATRLLHPEEVLVLFATSDMDGITGTEPSVVIALTAEGFVWASLPPRSGLAALTTALRCAAALTDPQCQGGASNTRGAFSLDEGSQTRSRGRDFDYDLAYRAYSLLLDPVSAAFEGKTSLIIVPDKALAAMPMHLLLTEAPTPETTPRDAPWLIRKMAVSTAPSVSSLAAGRAETAPHSNVDRPFLGVGDPLIGIQRNAPVPVDCTRYTEPELLTAALALPGDLLTQGGLTRGGAVAALPALPETRCELAATAAFFGPDSELMLQGDATETALKSLSQSGDLARYRVLSFATHGLLTGELGANQAGLVLTPPETATSEDDGILTIEEIAGLRIDADFVLLSACNTAAGSRMVDDSLSGLASAFFLAGARSLLVSHWPVYSDAAVRLTTGMYGALASDPSIGRAEALRRSMLAILDDPASDPTKLHPAYWGPFIIVGGG